MIHITPEEFGLVCAALSRVTNRFYAFGSRVKETHSQFSDLDIGYFETIPRDELIRIKDELRESNLPYKVDLVALDRASSTFKSLIEKDLTPLPVFSVRQVASKSDIELFNKIVHHPQRFSLVKESASCEEESVVRFLLLMDEEVVAAYSFAAKKNVAAFQYGTVLAEHTNRGVEHVALACAERWALANGYAKVRVVSAEKTLEFWRQHGYRMARSASGVSDVVKVEKNLRELY